jgi:hypothetical protein
MVEPKPLRPRARRGGSTGKTVERVSLDIVDLRVIESELSAIGPIILTSEQFEGEAASVDEFTNHDLQSLDELSFSVQDPETFRRPISVDLTRERAFIWIRDTSHALAGARHAPALLRGAPLVPRPRNLRGRAEKRPGRPRGRVAGYPAGPPAPRFGGGHDITIHTWTDPARPAAAGAWVADAQPRRLDRPDPRRRGSPPARRRHWPFALASLPARNQRAASADRQGPTGQVVSPLSFTNLAAEATRGPTTVMVVGPRGASSYLTEMLLLLAVLPRTRESPE